MLSQSAVGNLDTTDDALQVGTRNSIICVLEFHFSGISDPRLTLKAAEIGHSSYLYTIFYSYVQLTLYIYCSSSYLYTLLMPKGIFVASWSIALIKVKNSVGAITQPCLTPTSSSKRSVSLPWLTKVDFIPLWRQPPCKGAGVVLLPSVVLSLSWRRINWERFNKHNLLQKNQQTYAPYYMHNPFTQTIVKGNYMHSGSPI